MLTNTGFRFLLRFFMTSNALSSAAAAGGRLRRNVRHLRLMRLCESNGRLNGCTGLRTIFPAR